MIVLIDEETENELQRHKKNIIKSTDCIINLINIVHERQKKADKEERRKNPYIVKSVIKYLSRGLNKQDALALTALDFDTSVERVSSIVWSQNRYMSAVNLFAKRYTCEKLKRAGFTAKQIASIIGVSENHIYKLLRCNIDFWFLA